jgi:hypothetical protein
MPDPVGTGYTPFGRGIELKVAAGRAATLGIKILDLVYVVRANAEGVETFSPALSRGVGATLGIARRDVTTPTRRG